MEYSACTRFLLNCVLTAVLAGFFSSCQYDFIEEELPDPNKQYSFAEDILPIFASKNCIACHRAGSTPPDLTSANAYNAIVPALINIAEPEGSKIYIYPHPATSAHGYQKYSLAQAETILGWIRQGAKNN